MSNFDVSIEIQGTAYTVFPGKVLGGALYELVGLSPEEYLLCLDVGGEVDIPISLNDTAILTGGESFVISRKCSELPGNPILKESIPFSLNGEEYVADEAFLYGKITVSEIASRLDYSENQRFILDLDGLADQVLPEQGQIIVGHDWRIISTPYEGEEVDVEDCSNSGKPVPPARHYRIRVGDEKFKVDVPHMLGREILALAGLCNIEQHALYQKLKGGETLVIAPDEKVDFTAPGVERFVTIPLDMTEGFEPRRHFDLPPDDISFLNSNGLPWETVLEKNVRRVLIHELPIPDGYNVQSAVVNLRIESGYPEAQIDMAYFYPDLRRSDGTALKAIASDSFDGKQWQRWSRHRTPQNPWRPGIDNVSTHLSAVQSWLKLELNK